MGLLDAAIMGFAGGVAGGANAAKANIDTDKANEVKKQQAIDDNELAENRARMVADLQVTTHNKERDADKAYSQGIGKKIDADFWGGQFKANKIEVDMTNPDAVLEAKGQIKIKPRDMYLGLAESASKNGETAISASYKGLAQNEVANERAQLQLNHALKSENSAQIRAQASALTSAMTSKQTELRNLTMELSSLDKSLQPDQVRITSIKDEANKIQKELHAYQDMSIAYAKTGKIPDDVEQKNNTDAVAKMKAELAAQTEVKPGKPTADPVKPSGNQNNAPQKGGWDKEKDANDASIKEERIKILNSSKEIQSLYTEKQLDAWRVEYGIQPKAKGMLDLGKSNNFSR